MEFIRTTFPIFIVMLALVGAVAAPARVEVFVARGGPKTYAGNCARYFRYVFNGPLGEENVDANNHYVRVARARKVIYRTYRELGVVPESEIADLEAEDGLFPSSAVLYVQSVNDVTGEVEAILRVVTSDLGLPIFYSPALKTFPTALKSEAPIYHKYSDPHFRHFFKTRFPKVTELGRLVYAKNLSRLRKMRALVDMVTVVCEITRMRDVAGYSSDDHFIVAEAVGSAVHDYESLGLVRVPDCPIALNDGRQLMARPIEDIYRRFLGNVRTAAAAVDRVPLRDRPRAGALLTLFDEAIEKFSPDLAFRRVYNYGHYQRAIAHYQLGRFGPMRKELRGILRFTDPSADLLLSELYAEVGSRFDFLAGRGDLPSAIAFLDDPATAARFSDRKVRAPSPGLLTFLKGLVYLSAGDYAGAKQLRLAIGRLGAPGQVWPDFEGEVEAAIVRDLIRDGKWEAALFRIDDAKQKHPLGLTSPVYAVEAEVLAALGEVAESARAREKANALRLTDEERNAEIDFTRLPPPILRRR